MMVFGYIAFEDYINLTLETSRPNFFLFDNILNFDLLKLFLSSYVSP